MINLTVIILTRNEEKNILDCLESVQDAAEIIVIDDNSSDRTIEIVRSHKNNIKLFSHNLDDNFSEQRNYALSKATHEWVLFVDVDERVSKDLLKEIESTISNATVNGFYIKRTDVMWGKELKHGETGNIKLLRLAKKSLGKWSGSVHETWNVKGKTGTLKNKIVHYPHQTVREFISEIDFYTTLRAIELSKKKVKVNFIDIILYPKSKFIINYILKLGFLDGIPGFVFAMLMSFHSFLVRGKLYLIYNRNEG